MLTPNHIVSLARIVAAALGLAMSAMLAGLVAVDWMTCGIFSFMLGAACAAALPRNRSADILLIVTAGIVASACVGTLSGRNADLASAAAALGGQLFLFIALKLQRLRGMAARNGYMSFAEWRKEDRRNSYNKAMQVASIRAGNRRG